MKRYLIEASFEMTNGQVLSCEYVLAVWEGKYSGPFEECYPDETEVGDPSYFIDGVPVQYEKLPKGLRTIADKMFDAGKGQYNYQESII